MGKKKHSNSNPRWANEIKTTHKGLCPNKKYKIKAKEDKQQIRLEIR